MPSLTVGSKHLQYTQYVDGWQMCRDFAEGEERVKARGSLYLDPLPGHQGDSDPRYLHYKNGAVLYEATAKTVESFAGMIFRKEPVVEAPAAALDILSNVDGCGHDVGEFALSLLQELLSPGRAGVLTEMPEQSGDSRLTVAEAEAMGRRPFVVTYTAEQIWNWSELRFAGSAVRRLVEVHLHEEIPTSEVIGEAERSVGQVRVLFIEDGAYRQQLYRQIRGEWKAVGEKIVPEVNGQPIGRIPFRFANWADSTSKARRALVAPLVQMNRAHYRNSALHESGLGYCALPQPVVINDRPGGMEFDEEGNPVDSQQDDVRRIGGGQVWELQGQGADAKYLEFTGQGLQPIVDAMDRKEQKMAVLGARMLAAEKSGVEAADTARIYRIGENGSLARVAKVLEDTIAGAVGELLEFAGMPGGFSFSVNRDYLPATVTPQLVDAMRNMHSYGGIDDEDLHHFLVMGELRNPERTLDEVSESLERQRSRRTAELGGLVA